MTQLALFDLDHTLLSGDSDELWCEFLIDCGLLDRRQFESANQRMAQLYRAGEASPDEFCNFYVGTLVGRRPEEWQKLRERFLLEYVAPRLPASALELVDLHRGRGDLLVLTTATNRYITELTARQLGIATLIATEAELIDGKFSGRTTGTLNMREGKVVRMLEWLAALGLDAGLLSDASFYSDSANDLPLLGKVGRAVAVDPDLRLQAEAETRGWEVLRLRR